MSVTSPQNDASSESQEVFAFSVRLAASNIDEALDHLENAFYGGDCHDATIGVHAGELYIAFDREANSLEDALVSAIKQIEVLAPAVEIVRVVPPGAETIEAVNAYLRVRHQFRGKLPETIRRQVDAVLHALVAENKDKLLSLLAAPDAT